MIFLTKYYITDFFLKKLSLYYAYVEKPNNNYIKQCYLKFSPNIKVLQMYYQFKKKKSFSNAKRVNNWLNSYYNFRVT